MKNVFYILFYVFLNYSGYTQIPKINSIEKIKAKEIYYYKFEKQPNPFTGFSTDALNDLFLPLHGGIFLPKDSNWLIPPKKGRYFTSFYPNEKDTGFYTISNTSDYSEIHYVKTSYNKTIRESSVCKFEKGIYNLIFKEQFCYIWGYSKNKTKIGILIGNKVKWFFTYNGIINQVQLNYNKEVFFSINNIIYNLSNRKVALNANNKILGFDFDKNNNLIISTQQGTGYYMNTTFKIITKKAFGLLQCSPSSIYILPVKSEVIVELRDVAE